MATVRLATTSLLTAVTTTAGTVTDLVQSIGTGAKMLNDFASNARQQQLLNIDISSVGYEENLRARKALEIVENQQKLQDYIGDDPDKAARIAKVMAEFDRRIAARKP